MPGFEPRKAVLETAVIPFHHIPINMVLPGSHLDSRPHFVQDPQNDAPIFCGISILTKGRTERNYRAI